VDIKQQAKDLLRTHSTDYADSNTNIHYSGALLAIEAAISARPAVEGVTQRALRQQKAAREGVCLWSQQDDGYDTYSTGCGQEFTVNDCTDGNVKLPYCPFCAMDLESRAWAADDDAKAHPAQAGGEES